MEEHWHREHFVEIGCRKDAISETSRSNTHAMELESSKWNDCVRNVEYLTGTLQDDMESGTIFVYVVKKMYKESKKQVSQTCV